MLPNSIYEELNSMHIVLASSSKTREDLLKRLGLNIDVHLPNFEENLNPNDYSNYDYVTETALGKVLSVEQLLKEKNIKPDIIIGADTMVEYSGKLYGKPSSKEEAFDILSRLTSSGFPNIAHTGVVIKLKGQIAKFVESTTVYMEILTKEQVLEYVKTGEPMKYAGGYAIQAGASTFIERIEGDYNNVTGLPLCRVKKELTALLTPNGIKKINCNC